MEVIIVSRACSPMEIMMPPRMLDGMLEDVSNLTIAVRFGSIQKVPSPVQESQCNQRCAGDSAMCASSFQKRAPTSVCKMASPAAVLATICYLGLLQELCMSDAAYNPELAWLSFNWRVIAMAMDPSTPLFEKLRFVVSFSLNAGSTASDAQITQPR